MPDPNSIPPLFSSGPYRFLGVIGQGSQGMVYRALDTRTGATVAVKVLHAGSSGTVRSLPRFNRECQALSRIDHPNVVRILDAGCDSSGSLFLVMDYVAGPTLDEYLAPRRGKPGYLHEVQRIFRTIALALDTIHHRGIIHRDLKPSNVRIDEHGDVHLLDFGLAAEESPGPAAPDHAASHYSIVGSLPWTSPEHLGGGSSVVDGRSDLYSLAVMLYRELAGRFPYAVGGPPQEIMASVVASPPAPLTVRDGNLRATVGLGAMLARALSKAPAARYQTGRQFAAALDAAVCDVPTRRLAAEVIRRHGWRHLLAACGIVLLLCPCLPPAPRVVPPAFTDSAGIAFVSIPAGEFLMGVTADEPGGEEGLQHRVRLTHPFLMSVTEVTVQQYRRVMGPALTDADRATARKAMAPVTRTQALAFCRTLSEREHRHYRLPTDAEWEYACRAGTTDRFGNRQLDDVGWYRDNFPHGLQPDVATKLPNAWGLYDMHGGMLEWTSSYFGQEPVNSATTDPQGGAQDVGLYVLRGGTCESTADFCRAASCWNVSPDSIPKQTGIRLVLDPQE